MNCKTLPLIILLLIVAQALTSCVGSFGWEDPPPPYHPSKEEIAAKVRYDTLEKEKNYLCKQADVLEAEMDNAASPDEAAKIATQENDLALAIDEIQRMEFDQSDIIIGEETKKVQGATLTLQEQSRARWRMELHEGKLSQTDYDWLVRGQEERYER